jgi:hypothetical protein
VVAVVAVVVVVAVAVVAVVEQEKEVAMVEEGKEEGTIVAVVGEEGVRGGGLNLTSQAH